MTGDGVTWLNFVVTAMVTDVVSPALFVRSPSHDAVLRAARHLRSGLERNNESSGKRLVEREETAKGINVS